MSSSPYLDNASKPKGLVRRITSRLRGANGRESREKPEGSNEGARGIRRANTLAGNGQRERALRERGLLPPLEAEDLSHQESEQDKRLDQQAYVAPVPTAGPSAADLIRQQWAQKNTSIPPSPSQQFEDEAAPPSARIRFEELAIPAYAPEPRFVDVLPARAPNSPQGWTFPARKPAQTPPEQRPDSSYQPLDDYLDDTPPEAIAVDTPAPVQQPPPTTTRQDRRTGRVFKLDSPVGETPPPPSPFSDTAASSPFEVRDGAASSPFHDTAAPSPFRNAAASSPSHRRSDSLPNALRIHALENPKIHHESPALESPQSEPAAEEPKSATLTTSFSNLKRSLTRGKSQKRRGSPRGNGNALPQSTSHPGGLARSNTTRNAISPVVHSRTTIAQKAEEIDDEESRRLAEMCFMD